MSHKDRKTPRAIVRYSSKIQTAAHEIDCMVVDMSVTGARIHISEKNELPASFTIQIQLIPETAPLTLKVRKIWRQRTLAGLHFDNLPRKEFLILDALIKIHRAEVRKL